MDDNICKGDKYMPAPRKVVGSDINLNIKDKDDLVTINLIDFAEMISTAADLMEKGVFNHGQRVAYIAYRLYDAIYPNGDSLHLIIGSYLHDIGISTFELKKEARNFILDEQLVWNHCRDGEELIRGVRLLDKIRQMVLHHHTNYEETLHMDISMPLEAEIIHLSDRVDVLIKNDVYILEQSDTIKETITNFSGTMFHPMLVDAFLDLADKESFWFDVINEHRYTILKDKHYDRRTMMTKEDIRQFANLCGKIVDRKSPYTTVHSERVAQIAVKLGKLFGMSENDIFYLEIAGLLHDLGKLSVPEAILHKSGGLSKAEFSIIKQHTYHTYHLIDRLQAMDKVRDWAAFHHEKLDGSGYPFRKRGQELDLGARIMSVADISTALTEDRSYRPRMNKMKTLDILWKQVRNNWIDGDVVNMLQKNYDEIIMR